LYGVIFTCSSPQEELFIKFAEFEEKCKEPERARAIYKYALDHIPKGQAQDVYKKFVAFEKQHGDREGIEVNQSCLLQRMFCSFIKVRVMHQMPSAAWCISPKVACCIRCC